jgi:hypothetical protein
VEGRQVFDREVQITRKKQNENQNKTDCRTHADIRRCVCSNAQQQLLTGVVTDSMCGVTHMAKDNTPAECTKMCVKSGRKY